MIMDIVKVTVIAVVSALMSWLGILAVPVLLLVGCNIIDYATGLCAVKYRNDNIKTLVHSTSLPAYLCIFRTAVA